MKESKRWLIWIIISLPMLVLGVLGVEPRPLELLSTWQSARLAVAQERYSDAADLYRKLIEFQPDKIDLWNSIGDFEIQAGNYPGAIDAYVNAKHSGIISNEGLFNLGIAYKNIGDNLNAIYIWQDLSNRVGLDDEEYYEVVAALRELGDFEGSLQAARNWVKTFPENTYAAYTLGLLLTYTDPAQAVQILLPISASDVPESQKSQIVLQGLETSEIQDLPEYNLVVIGQRLLQIGEFDLAEQAFTNAVTINPNYAEAWVMLSEAQQSCGKDGWPALEKAQGLNPKSEMVRSALALYYRRQGEPDKALPILLSLAEDYPDQASWVIEIGVTLADQGKLLDALAAFQKAVEIEPKNAKTWRALATFTAENGFDMQSYSIPAAKRALELDNEDPLSLDVMGWILFIDGDLKQAEQFLQQAKQKDVANPRIMLHLAQVYIEMDRLSLAYKPLSQAAAQETDPSTALQAQRLLDLYFNKQP